MLFHSDPLFCISWGDKSVAFPAKHFYDIADSKALRGAPQFNLAYTLMGLDSIIVLKQVHGTRGYVINKANQLEQFLPYQHEGDYLITNLARVGLAIAAADCLPVIMYDPQANIVGIAHAGWRGSLQQVGLKTLEHMREAFGINPKRVQVFFGPSAKSCCYEIKDDMAIQIERFSYGSRSIQERDGKLFFDVPLFNLLQLEQAGVTPSAFHVHYNLCTICNPSFCSHRRDGPQSLRQMTIVSLK